LERVNSRLRAANQLATDLIAMLSHDLRQPLTTIIGYTEMLADDKDPDSGQQRRALERTHAAARQLQQLVEDVLVMAQSDAGVMPTRPARVAVSESLRASLSTLAISVDDVEVDQPVEAYAQVDPGHLRQILTNLIGNAFKYGARPVQVTVATAPRTVEIRVSDHGRGVPQEFVPQIFDRFTRAANGVAQGTGLGLYIVRQLTLVNGGSVHYEPRQPHGSTFVVRLPSSSR
ncbi:MAG TPA: HAMP domain-containing sensor histidine kinase, partial [Pilimelia sp.]|nr:HAMP domain-containing sensor histidine kinase [Pilimelia sp.]